jgi:Fe-S-cluster containining protein
MDNFELLKDFYNYIEGQCKEVINRSPWWPCAKGCCDCCNYSFFMVSQYEWDYMMKGIEKLSKKRQNTIVSKAQSIVNKYLVPYMPIMEWKPVVNELMYVKIPCPFLYDNECSIYEQRPSICRLYGFYVLPTEEELGTCFWCPKVSEELGKQQLEGNGPKQAPDLKFISQAMDSVLYGKIAPLTAWIIHARHDKKI